MNDFEFILQDRIEFAIKDNIVIQDNISNENKEKIKVEQTSIFDFVKGNNE